MCGFLLTLNCKISKELFQDSLDLIEYRGRDDTRILNLNKSGKDIFIDKMKKIEVYNELKGL